MLQGGQRQKRSTKEWKKQEIIPERSKKNGNVLVDRSLLGEMEEYEMKTILFRLHQVLFECNLCLNKSW